MPQIILTLSQNINAQAINFKKLFAQIHEALKSVPNMDAATAHSGVVQESFSYIGFDNPKATKVYLELYWMEDEARAAMKPALGKTLMNLLVELVAPAVEEQGLLCIPRVRIANLGTLNQSYFIRDK